MRVLLIVSLAFFMACAGQSMVTIDGKIDQMEESLIRLGADAAMTAKPDMTQEVYDITGAMLPVMASTSVMAEGMIAELIREEAIKAGIMPAEAETLVSMAYMMQSAMIAKVGAEKAALVLGKGAIVRDIIKIIHDQAGRRLAAG
jgi:hypothetical protein